MMKFSIRKWKFSIFKTIFLCFIVYGTYVGFEIFKFRQFFEDGEYVDLTGKVVIFMGTPVFGPRITNENLGGCIWEVKNSCAITSNGAQFSQANAVVFHSRDINGKKLRFLPFERNPKIPYIMMALENPYYAYMEEYRNYFNWTMTYRQDSDVFIPYGALVKNNGTEKLNFTKIWNLKTKDTLWLVSNNEHVKNRRKEVVDRMKRLGMNIDLLGKVYNREPEGCLREGGSDGCDEKLHSPYKFTIAFENSNCKDYVTEKFWRKAAKYKMVPIVMTRKIYKDLGIPDSMYISLDDFPNLKVFVDYITKAAANETEYMKFHKWREEFRIIDINEGNFGFCQLCQKLMDFKGVPMKSYENLDEWHSTNNCDNSFANKYL